MIIWPHLDYLQPPMHPWATVSFGNRRIRLLPSNDEPITGFVETWNFVSILLVWNSDVNGPVSGAAGDDMLSTQKHAYKAGCEGPYATEHDLCVLRNIVWVVIIVAVDDSGFCKSSITTNNWNNFLFLLEWMLRGRHIAGRRQRCAKERAKRMAGPCVEI